MPKKSLKIDKFEGGLVNYYNPRDIPDNSFVEAQDIMVDIQGKVRLMGQYKTYVHGTQPQNDLSARCTPGYGLYSFSSDYNIDGDSQEVEILAIQRNGHIGLFDSQLHDASITLTSDTSDNAGPKCQPTFFYSNGALRVSDGYIEDVDGNGDQSHDSIDNRWFGFIDRTLMPDLDPSVDRVLKWTDEIQEIATPTVNSNNAIDDTTPDAGSLSMVVTWGANSSEGEWNGSELDTLTFGYSWLYDGEKQESKVALFEGNNNSLTAVDSELEIQIIINQDFSTIPNRVTGFRIYWMGEGGDLFDDPFQIAEGDFVNGNLTGHNNKVVDFAVDGVYYKTPVSVSALKIPTQPALTFRLINGYKHNVDSIIARYKTAVLANGVVYIGNIRQNGRNYHDRMIKSAIGPDGKGFFDVFPSDNFLDVAVEDGDAIIALAEYSDRLLQFKRKGVYVINISGDFEYVEDHQLFMGVNHPGAVVRIANGIAWVNQNGCYLYGGEGIVNLITNKINPIEWKRFVGTTGMISYIGPRQQLILAGTFNASEGSQDVYIYDIRTQSWTLGKDKIPNYSKSNFISNYKNTMLFASNQVSADESMETRTLSYVNPVANGEWHIPDLSGATLQDTVLQINGQDVTGIFSHSPGGTTQTAQEKVASEINNGPYSNFLVCNAAGAPNPLSVTMEGHFNDDTPADLSGSSSLMSFSNPPEFLGTAELFTGSLGQQIQDVGDSDLLMSITPMTSWGDSYFDVPAQEISIQMSWDPNSLSDSSRNGYYVAEMAGFWTSLKAAFAANYWIPQGDTRSPGIKLSGFTSVPTAPQITALNGTKFYPAPGSPSGSAGLVPDMRIWQQTDWYEHSRYTAPGEVTIKGFITEDIGLHETETVASAELSGDNIIFDAPSLRLDNVTLGNPTAGGNIYLAISYPRQIGGDIDSQYTSFDQYNNCLDSIAIPDARFTITIGSNSVLDGKTFETVASFTDDIGATFSSGAFQTSLDDTSTIDSYNANGNAWYKPQTLIVREADVPDGWINNGLVLGGGGPNSAVDFYESYTITVESASSSIDTPVTITIPHEGSGGRKLVIPKRLGNTGAGTTFHNTIQASNGEPTNIAYSTNLNDFAVEIVEGIDSAIATIGVPNIGLAAATTVSKSDLEIDIKDTAGVFTLEGTGLMDAGFVSDMEIELVAGTGSGHSNNGFRFLISEAIPGTIDKLTINAVIDTPYAGLSAPVAQDNKQYDLKGGGILIQDNLPQTDSIAEFSVSSNVESGKITLHEFTNNSSDDSAAINNSSSSLRLLTKEFDFQDMSKRKNVVAIYVSHNYHSKIALQYIADGNISSEITPMQANDNDNSLRTVKYPVSLKGVRTFQLLLTSKESVDNYILNDITIVYRERSSR